MMQLSNSTPALNFLGAELAIACKDGEYMKATHVPGSANTTADYLSRPSKQKTAPLPKEHDGVPMQKPCAELLQLAHAGGRPRFVGIRGSRRMRMVNIPLSSAAGRPFAPFIVCQKDAGCSAAVSAASPNTPPIINSSFYLLYTFNGPGVGNFRSISQVHRSPQVSS